MWVAFTLLLLPLVFFGLRFPSRRGLSLGRVPGSSRYFSFFMFLRFHPLPSSLFGLVPLFLLPAVVSFLLRSFRAVSIFSFFSALPRVLCPLFSSSGSSLGLLPPALGSGRCVLLWVSLTSSCRVAILRAVSSAVFLLCLFLFLCSLPWPGLRCWFASVSYLSSSVLSRR